MTIIFNSEFNPVWRLIEDQLLRNIMLSAVCVFSLGWKSAFPPRSVSPASSLVFGSSVFCSSIILIESAGDCGFYSHCNHLHTEGPVCFDLFEICAALLLRPSGLVFLVNVTIKRKPDNLYQKDQEHIKTPLKLALRHISGSSVTVCVDTTVKKLFKESWKDSWKLGTNYENLLHPSPDFHISPEEGEDEHVFILGRTIPLPGRAN